MRIVYVANSTIPSRRANSVHVMKMCHAFAKWGHDVRLVVPRRSFCERRQPAHDYYGVAENFTIKKTVIPRRRSISSPSYWESAIRGYLFGPDLVYGRSIGACARSAALGLPTFFELHTLDDIRSHQAAADFASFLKSKNCVGVVVISSQLRDDLIETYSALKNKVHVLHDAADPIADTVRPRLANEPSERLQVGYVGQLYPGKGYEIIRPLATIADWADFHVVGGTEASLSELAREGVPNNLVLHGFVPPSEVPSYLVSFDVLLAPYQNEVYGEARTQNLARWMSPLKLFEYMAAGKAILCSDLPVLREILTTEENAILCSPDSVDDWLTALRRINNDLDLRVRLGQRALADFLTNHTWDTRAVALVDIVAANRGKTA